MSRKIPVECPLCHNTRPLRKCDARRAELRGSVCGRCQRVAAGKVGYRVTLLRYGPDFALDAIARREKIHPSSPESDLREMLAGLGIEFETQVKFKQPLRAFVLDVVFTSRSGISVCVECCGFWHQLVGKERDLDLSRTWCGHVEFIHAEDIENCPDLVRARLVELAQM